LKNALINADVNDHYDPVGKAYYHDFNPNFSFNIRDTRYLSFTPTLTLRDGLLTFGRFVLKQKDYLSKLNVHFLIHPDLAVFVPTKLVNHFSTWSLSQSRQIPLTDAKKVIIFGIAHESYLKDLKSVENQLKKVKGVSPCAEIQICLPLRKNIFNSKEEDSTFSQEVFSLIKDSYPQRPLKIVRYDDFMNQASFRGELLFDLAPDRYFVADNFMHYLFASRGGVVNFIPNSAPKDTFFTIPLSFHHKLHLMPLPKVESRFKELEEYKRISRHINPLCDPVFQNIIRGVL
jgi:hypothetical protein